MNALQSAVCAFKNVVRDGMREDYDVENSEPHICDGCAASGGNWAYELKPGHFLLKTCYDTFQVTFDKDGKTKCQCKKTSCIHADKVRQLFNIE